MIRAIIALLAAILTGAQTFYIYTGGVGFCFNEGCGIVERLTRVPQLYFNLAGFSFFLLLFICFMFGRNGSDLWIRFARLLLLAAVGAEAVLVFFQQAIAQAFCSYCLIICSAILLLNILSGGRQTVRLVVVACGVMVAAYSLKFTSPGSGATARPLREGTIMEAVADPADPPNFLIFSETCPHCERIIEQLRESNSCRILFNPVERLVRGFDFPDGRRAQSYDPNVNLNFLRTLGINTIPVLMVGGQDQLSIIRGEEEISAYLKENCDPLAAAARFEQENGQSGSAAVVEDCEVNDECGDQGGSVKGTILPGAAQSSQQSGPAEQTLISQ